MTFPSIFFACLTAAQAVPKPVIAIELRQQTPLWMTENRYRLSLDAPLLPQSREGQIAWADVPLAYALDQLGHPECALSWPALRLLRPGHPQPIPFSIERRGGVYRLAWKRPDKATKVQRYYFYFDIKGHGETTSTPPPVFIGVGDRLEFGRTGVKDFIGWGLWATPLVLDWDNDADLDVLVYAGGPVSPGTYLFRNDGQNIFARGEYVGQSGRALAGDFNGDGRIDAMKRGGYFSNIVHNGFEKKNWVQLDAHDDYYRGRFTYWLPVDWNGDGLCDVLAATSDWRKYGWDAGYDNQGNWLKGLLHAALYVHINKGSPEKRELAKGVRLTTPDGPVDSFGMPVPCVADWDGDGDLDVILGSFVDWLTYYENVGSRTEPKLAPPREVKRHDGTELRLSHCMMQPVPVDWDADGDLDLIIGEEDGMVSFVENVAGPKTEPRFRKQVYLRGFDVPVRTGALCVPNLVDWDADGDLDLITGCVQGKFELFTNVGANTTFAFERTGYLKAGERTWQIRAGVNGSIQGPCEAKWGYTAPYVADWDADGLLDIVTNSIWGKILWAKNVGTKTQPKLATPQPITVEWEGKPPKPEWTWFDPQDSQLVTQWRTRPVVTDLNHDSLPDLVVLDHEGYLALFERYRDGDQLKLKHPQRVFLGEKSQPLRLTSKLRGRSGRVKIDLVDWDADGDLDLLYSTKSIGWFENVGSDKNPVMRKRANLCDRVFCGHTDSPATFDFNRDGKLDLLVGAEDGHFYVFDRDYIAHKDLYQVRIMSK